VDPSISIDTKLIMRVQDLYKLVKEKLFPNLRQSDDSEEQEQRSTRNNDDTMKVDHLITGGVEKMTDPEDIELMTSSLKLYGVITENQDSFDSEDHPHDGGDQSPVDQNKVMFTPQNLGLSKRAVDPNGDDHTNTLLFTMVKNKDYLNDNGGAALGGGGHDDENLSMDEEYGEEEINEDGHERSEYMPKRVDDESMIIEMTYEFDIPQDREAGRVKAKDLTDDELVQMFTKYWGYLMFLVKTCWHHCSVGPFKKTVCHLSYLSHLRKRIRNPQSERSLHSSFMSKREKAKP
jgi:hypothetical protein